MASDGLVVIRNYLRMMKGTDVSGFANKTLKYLPLIQEERVQVYSSGYSPKSGQFSPPFAVKRGFVNSAKLSLGGPSQKPNFTALCIPGKETVTFGELRELSLRARSLF